MARGSMTFVCFFFSHTFAALKYVLADCHAGRPVGIALAEERRFLSRMLWCMPCIGPCTIHTLYSTQLSHAGCSLSRQTAPKHNVSISTLDCGGGVLGVILCISFPPNSSFLCPCCLK